MSEPAIDRWITAGLVLYGLGVAAALLLVGMHSAGVTMGAANLTYDDGYYYLKIAEHVAHGAGSTFDGVSPTNGYHPLWLLCLVPIFWLISAPDAALVGAVVLQGVLMAASVGLTYRIARFDLGRFGAILAALLWVHCQLPYRVALSGLEYSLHAAVVLSAILVFRRCLTDHPPRLRTHLALGALLALTFLARLDSILLMACIASVVGLRELRGGFARAGLQRLLALSLPAVGAVVAYVGANMWLVGHPLPINGVIKRDWSARLMALDPHFRAHGWLAAKLGNLFWCVGNMKPAYVLFLAAGSAGIAGVWLVRPLRAKLAALAGPPTFWGSLVLFSVLQLSFFLLFCHQGYSFQRWYYVVQPWLGALLLAMVAEKAWQHANRWPPFAGAGRPSSWMAIAILAALPLASARTVWQWHQETLLGASRIPLYAAGQWMRANVPDDATVGSWNAGTISYLSGRRVVNLDGLVNSWDFYQSKRYDLCGYWRAMGVTYLVDTFEIDREVAFIDKYYSPGVDLSPCAARLNRVWVGPAYPNQSEHAIAFTLR